LDFAADELAGDSTLKLAMADNNLGNVGLEFLSGIENVVVDVAARNKGAMTFKGAVVDLKTLTVTGDGDVTFATGASKGGVGTIGTGVKELTSFDAIATTGEVNFRSQDLTYDYTAVGGSGDNTLNFSAVTNAD